MALNTVKYYLDALGIDTGSYRIHLDFESGLSNSSYYTNQYRLIPYGNLTGIFGSGTLSSNQFAQFSGINGVDGEYSTHVFAVSKNSRNDGVLFSNFGGSGIYSGYTIGINAANKLYFECRDNLGPVVRTFPARLANNNLIAVSKIKNTVDFFLLNQNSKELISESYDIGNFVLPSNAWWLGTSTGNIGHNYTNFSGYLDEYLYFSEALMPNDIRGVMSGIYQRYNDIEPSFLVTGYSSYTSGYINSGNPSGIQYNASGLFNYSGQLFYNTGGAFSFYDLGLLTGFAELLDDCGNTTFVYKYLNHTGVLQGDTFIPLTGNLINYSTVSGFSSGYIPTGQFITGVTGFLTGIFPSFTGITGSQLVFSNFTTDNCGNVNGVYSINNITGVLSGSGILPLTGLIFSGIQSGGYQTFGGQFDITFVINPSYYTDDGYIYALGFHGANYLRTIETGDMHEIYLPRANHNLNHINRLGQFDTIKSGFILPNYTSSSGLNSFLNGGAQLSSGAAVSGDFYNPYLYLSGSNFITGRNTVIGHDYLGTDSFLYDIKTGIRSHWIITGTGVQEVTGLGNDIFLNGQKLRSGIDYSLTGHRIILDSIYNDHSGYLFGFPRIEGIRSTGLTSGFPTVLFSPPFARGTSQLFLNGQRQLINNDYLEISNVDLLTGSGNFLSNQISPYENEGSFWQ